MWVIGIINLSFRPPGTEVVEPRLGGTRPRDDCDEGRAAISRALWPPPVRGRRDRRRGARRVLDPRRRHRRLAGVRDPREPRIPWGLAAFLIGLRTTSLRKGALAGALALLLGVATYYVGVALRGYVFGGANAVWTVVAVVAGPIMGQSGAAVSARRERPPVAAVAAPAAMLLAEAIFFVIDRRIWLYDLRTQPYRLVDLGIVALLLAGALVIPVRFAKDRRPLVYLVVAAAGACGALGFQASYRLIVAIT
jgi:hypothetical protein